jgi:hypothetical protein
MSGYLDSSGNDLSDLFAPYVTGTIGAQTGYKDLAGNDLNTLFAPYTSGATVRTTRYLDLSRNDLNTRFAPFPSFPTVQSSVPNMGGNVCVDMDGVNCVVSTTMGGSPAGDTYTFLYWSNNACVTLNKATINGNANQKFWGCVAISGPNAIAMGRLTSSGTNTFFLSNDYGKTYTSTSGQVAGQGYRVFINISGSIAVWGNSDGGPVYYSTNAGLTWATSNLNTYVNAIAIYGNNVYVCSATDKFWYSTNGGQSFTRNINYPSSTANAVVQIGTNIYIGSVQYIYKLTTANLSATPSIAFTVGANIYSIAISGCKTSTGGDFLIIGTDTTSNFYSNNGGTLQGFLKTSNMYKIVATNSRIVYGGGSNIYWGKNAYVT